MLYDYRRLKKIAAAAGLVLLLAFSGCSSKKSGDSGKLYSMGSAVSAGPLTYTVVDAEWRESLMGPNGTRIPASRWLLLNISVTSSAAEELGVPLLTLIGADGKEYREEDKGDGVPQWLGLLRGVRPAQTESGRILFDVPPGGYKLRVSSGGDAEKEQTALVDIPFNAEAAPIKGVDPMAAPPPAK